MKCCNKPINQQQLDSNTIGVWCTICGKKGKGNTKEIAYENLKKSNPTDVMLPNNPSQLPTYISQKINDIALLSAPFVAKDKPALQRMIKKNIRYITNIKDSKFLNVWKTKDGQESIIDALEEAFSLGASLPEMGSIVPFGTVVEFIPAVEAFNFALTNGDNPPFKWIQIECIHKNDKHKITRKNGNFEIENQPGVPRGELISIAVYGHNTRLDKVIGEVYDKERLLEKAKIHSISYKYYLDDIKAFEYARSEGKTQIIEGKECIIRQMPSRNGGTWDKTVYIDDLTNPYINADQPEMLRKFAGKSFLRPYVKVRNSEAAIEEMKEEADNIDMVIDDALTRALNVIPGEEKEDKNQKDNEKMNQDKKEEQKNDNNVKNEKGKDTLFNGQEIKEDEKMI